jgi:hypothetical protein|tara:strand:+ start:322 stop:777 length:456 start_codon:yes stop_codon:yes gene_type:complete
MTQAEANRIDGQCLCGAVHLQLSDHRPEIGICHCMMCRRWSGGAYVFFTAPADSVRISGAVTTYRSSPFSQRAFCPTCGSGVYLRDDESDEYELCAGLFDHARKFAAISEAYVDQRLEALTLQGDHKRVTAAEYEEKFPFVPSADLPDGRA